jgi:hypothetical protein
MYKQYNCIIKKLLYFSFLVFRVVKIHILVLCIMTICSPLGEYQNFGTSYYLHLGDESSKPHCIWCHTPAYDNTKHRIVFILSHLGAKVNNNVCSNPVTDGTWHIC